MRAGQNEWGNGAFSSKDSAQEQHRQGDIALLGDHQGAQDRGGGLCRKRLTLVGAAEEEQEEEAQGEAAPH